jgi:hypothetical protein
VVVVVITGLLFQIRFMIPLGIDFVAELGMEGTLLILVELFFQFIPI